MGRYRRFGTWDMAPVSSFRAKLTMTTRNGPLRPHPARGCEGIVDNTGTKIVEYDWDVWGKPAKVRRSIQLDSALTSA